MPRLSVLVPARNAESTIDLAVRSTLASLDTARVDAEVLVFDDRSEDATAAALEAIDDRRLRVVRSPTATGVTGGLNALLDASDSEIVARMDADDRVLRSRFARQLAALGSGTDVVFSTVTNWRPGRPVLPPAPVPIGPAAFPFHLLLTNPVSHPTMLARRAAIERVGGYRAVPAEDYDLWLRFAAAGFGIRRLAAPALLYRVHPGQITASTEWRHESWTDQRVAEAFATLSTRLLGAPFPRLTTLGFTANGADVEPQLAAFAGAFRAGISSLPWLDRAQLARRLTVRLGATRQLARKRSA
ncbi:glycosyltransferase family 2 protein [Glaciihabitans arcticus]|uniref:Glycosyltransferase family 2 protein n=1 Tax=Glaciihabitans arcticus TaxID=2668039 RepID=A0A4Q9GTI4_9MICO|nr:glycosyltransferase family A protein [Glaciihabitans arcticus]TBN57985.1 glycosyltransferase family 2 protein [Glaciihabitans arcticus]